MNVAITRVDSVYFTLTTLATVGYGDIHPASEACRKAASAQIIVSLVFVVIVLALLVSRIGQSLNSSTDDQSIFESLSQMQKNLDSLNTDLDSVKSKLDEAHAVKISGRFSRRQRKFLG
jgi:hypothetical protein